MVQVDVTTQAQKYIGDEEANKQFKWHLKIFMHVWDFERALVSHPGDSLQITLERK